MSTIHVPAGPTQAERDALVAGRHPKWQRVEPGYVIPAGQPYRVERWDTTFGPRASEYVDDKPHEVRPRDYPVFIDSSWKPPLVLPTEPTWALVVKPSGYVDTLEVWRDERQEGGICYRNAGLKGWMKLSEADAVIPLTDEHVARIGAAR